MKILVRLVTILGLAAPAGLQADTVTLPVAASVVGGAPFFSDVRVFNTSYTDVVNVTATYRCAPGTANCAPQPAKTFSLAPREAKAFDNICVSLFNVPNSLGAVEFTSSTTSLVVTSRLYSPAASPPWPAGTVGSVGMFIPGLPSSAAQPVTVLTNLANAGSATGSFRTNIGVYNPNATGVTATIRLYEFEGSFPPVLLGVMPLNLAGQTGTQVTNIYKTLGFETLQTTSGYATVESSDASKPLFTYAATADNTTQDPVLVVGAPDVPAPPGFNPPTPTAGSANPTPTPTTAAPTPTPTAAGAIVVNLVATEFQWSFNGSGNIFTLHVGQAYELHISDGDRAGSPAHGFSGIPALGLPAHVLTAGGPPVVETITPTPGQLGVFGFACDQSSCGVGHNSMTAAIEIIP